MVNYFAIIIVAIIGLMILWLLIKSHQSHYIVLLILFLFLGWEAYLFGDTITDSIKEISDKNQTINGTYYEQGQVISMKCEEGYDLKGSVCYNPSPFGHYGVGLFQMFAGVFGFAAILNSTVLAWRMYLSPKLKFLIDKFQAENKSIPKNINVYHKGNYTWMWGGFGRIIVGKTDEVFVAHNSMLSKISENWLYNGKRVLITPRALLEYLGGNIEIFKAILGNNASIEKNKLKITTDEGEEVKIYIPFPLTEKEYSLFLSEKGNYAIGADRFHKIIIELFKMRKAIRTIKATKEGSMTGTLTTGVTLSEKAGVILNEVNKGRKQDVVKGNTQPYQAQEPDRNGRQY